MDFIVDEVAGLYRVLRLKSFRKTPGVDFELFPMKALPRIDSIDRVLHQQRAVSPGQVGSVERPWYMHPDQDDNLIVLHGRRDVELYSVPHGKVESFVVTPEAIYKNGEMILEGGGILVWPRRVFHRIISGDEGSASLNLAVHYEGFDLSTNFNIYDLDPETGVFQVIRSGHEDQF